MVAGDVIEIAFKTFVLCFENEIKQAVKMVLLQKNYM